MQQYYYSFNDQKAGPVTVEQLQALCNCGQINGATLVWTQGMEAWQPLHTVLPQCTAAPAPVPGMVPTPVPMPMPAGMQPMPMPGMAPCMVKPDNGMVFAILATVLCCVPCGAYAIVKASSVDSLWMAGQYAQAVEAAKVSKQWSLISFILGGVATFIYFVCLMMVE